MEALIVVAVVVALLLALRAKSASQGALRYQGQKDALDAARRLMERFDHRAVVQSEGIDDRFDLSRTPLEFREMLGSDLEDLAVHVRKTRVPEDLGAPGSLRELLETLRRARALADGDVTAAGREKLRREFMDDYFEQLEEAAGSFEPGALIGADSHRRHVRWLIRSCRTALEWDVDGERVTIEEAKRILRFARTAVREEGADGERDGVP